MVQWLERTTANDRKVPGSNPASLAILFVNANSLYQCLSEETQSCCALLCSVYAR